MTDQPTSVQLLVGWLGAFLAAFGAITLSQWAVVIAVVGGFLAAVLTALNIYVIWRDKIIRGPGRYHKYERTGDTTRPADLI